MDTKVYRLFWEMSHITGTVYDASLVPFAGWENIAGWIGSEPHETPEDILFEADFRVTTRSDYPCNDVNWPLVSARFVEILHKLGDIPHRLIPVRLINRDVLGPARYGPDGSLRPEVVDDRFAALQLTQPCDVVDWDRSEFRRSGLNPDKIAHFRKLVLAEPANGFPPLFRLTAQASMLFVSAQARQALESSGIRGVKFRDLPGGSQYRPD